MGLTVVRWRSSIWSTNRRYPEEMRCPYGSDAMRRTSTVTPALPRSRWPEMVRCRRRSPPLPLLSSSSPRYDRSRTGKAISAKAQRTRGDSAKTPCYRLPNASWRQGLVNMWSNRAATDGIRATVTVQTRLVVLGDRIGRISKFADQIELSSQVQ